MGYRSYFKGRIDIVPPLSYAELKRVEGYWKKQSPEIYHDVNIEVAKSSEETEHGISISYRGIAIVPAWEEEYKGYSFEEELKDLVTKFKDTHQFSGTIQVEGEEPGDIWRMRVSGNTVIVERAKLSWPDGTETDFR